MIHFTDRQARQFILLKHGLLGEHKFIGKQGVLDFVRQAGCIQFDPVDVCGRNAELTLQSRVKNFTKQTLYELLYIDRKLVDYPDKNLSIIPVEDWPYFERYRKAARESGQQFRELAQLEDYAKAYIKNHGPVSSSELPIDGSIHWHSAIHWSGNWHGDTNAARSVLEQLYSTGELIIHHKKGTRKYYDLAEKHIPAELLNAPDPLPDGFTHQKWRVLRRIGAVGLMWNRPSDAWLNIWGLTAQQRNRAFNELLDEGRILEIKVQDLKDTLYCRAEDLSLIETVLKEDEFTPRCELIAPLDCMMWDRKLILALFGFDYTWEIYTPANKRKYGYYVLPLLYNDNFIGRLEPAVDKKTKAFIVKNIWYENNAIINARVKKAVENCITRFAKFNECSNTQFLH
ncbi:MAG TPA: winged helix-turn-helix domain-containing protein [Clostridiales bacterium]|nr:winged helix-turn-helix domain-containing protein [Clostridiales bacterium]